MGAAVAAVIAARERQTVEVFRAAGATSPASARLVSDLGVDPDGIGMRRLREHAVIRQAQPGLYYLDEEVWQALRRMRRRIVLVMLIVVLALMLSMLIVSSRSR
jgi:hypothetical protein